MIKIDESYIDFKDDLPTIFLTNGIGIKVMSGDAVSVKMLPHDRYIVTVEDDIYQAIVNAVDGRASNKEIIKMLKVAGLFKGDTDG